MTEGIIHHMWNMSGRLSKRFILYLKPQYASHFQSFSAPFDQYIDEKLRAEITGISRTTWWQLERQGKTPPVYRVRQMKRWLLSEVITWLALS